MVSVIVCACSETTIVKTPKVTLALCSHLKLNEHRRLAPTGNRKLKTYIMTWPKQLPIENVLHITISLCSKTLKTKHIKLHMHDACIHPFMAWMSETALAVASQASGGKLFMRYNATCLKGPPAQDASHPKEWRYMFSMESWTKPLKIATAIGLNLIFAFTICSFELLLQYVVCTHMPENATVNGWVDPTHGGIME